MEKQWYSYAVGDPTLGEIALWAGNYAPQGWAFCNGQLMSIADNPALYSLLGTLYGGNGTTNFMLPDLRGRIPFGSMQGPGLTDRYTGDRGGSESATFAASQIPEQAEPQEGPAYVSTSDGQQINKLPPYTVLTFIIALTGIYPSRS